MHFRLRNPVGRLNFKRIQSLFVNPKSTAIVLCGFFIAILGLIYLGNRMGIFSLASAGADPVAYWKFDEGVGSTANDSMGTNTGTLATGNSSPTWTVESQCISGKCLFFDGTNDYVTASSGLTNLSAISVSAWIKPKSINASSNRIIDKSSGAPLTKGWFVSLNPTNAIIFDLDTDASNLDRKSANNVITLNAWQHITVVWDGTGITQSTVKIYVNGKEVPYASGTDGTGTRTDDTGASVGIGDVGTGSTRRPFDGYIDDMKVYNYARSAAQVQADYTSRGTTKGVAAQFGNTDTGKKLSDGLIGYYKMDEVGVSGNNWTAIDSSGNNNNMTGAGNASVGTTIPGKFVNAGSFDGVGDWLSVGSSLNFGTTNSFAFWINYRDSGDAVIIGNAASRYAAYIDGSASNNSIYYNPDPAAGGAVSVVHGGLTSGTWYHFAVVRNGTAVSFYKNGVQLGSTQYMTTDLPLAIQSIGAHSNGGSNFELQGQLDEVRMYTRALSASDVVALYNFAPGPDVYYKFDEGTGTSAVKDSSGNGANGTQNGSVSNKNWVNGKFGKAYDFSSDYINTNDTMSVANLSQFTISTWVYIRTLDGTTRNIYIDCLAGSCSTRAAVSINSSNTLAINARDDDGDGSTTNCLTDNRALIANVWTHIEIVYDADANIHKAYINGVPFTDSGAGGCLNPFGTGVNASNKPKIGASFDGSANFFDGYMDDFKMYHYARTAAQVIEDMNGGHPSVGTPVGSTVFHMKMDEGYGTTINSSLGVGSPIIGTFGAGNSAPTWTNDGKFGKALSFDGTNDYVSIADTVPIRFDDATADFSVFAWVKRSVTGAVHYIVSKEDADNDGWRLQIDSGNTVTCSTGVTDVISTGTITDTNWHHVGCTIDRGGNGQVYLDANPSGPAVSVGSTAMATTASLTIGSRSYTRTSFFNGNIDDVKVYPFALTADQVKVEFAQGKAQVMGALSTGVGGTTPSYASSRELCVPGDASTCNAPVGEWKFEEGVGNTANDTSGNGSNLTMSASMLQKNWVKGKLGKALDLDGTNDTLTYPVAAGSALDLTGDITLEAWINLDQLSNTRGVDQSVIREFNTGSAATSYNLTLENNTTNTRVKMNWFNTGGTQYTVVSGTTNITSLNTWYHIAGVKSGSTMSVYVNGINVTATSDTPTGTLRNGASSFRVGYHTGTSNIIDGRLDNVQVYGYARTPAQIAWDYNKGGPFGYWKINECTGTTINDSTGNANTGTLTLGATGVTTAGTCTTSGAWADGASGKREASMSFDGSSDYIQVGDTDILDVGGSEDLSLTFWIKPSTISTSKAIISKKTSNAAGAPGYMIHVFNGGNLGFYIADTTLSNQVLTSVTIPLTVGTWTHVGIVYQAKTNPVIYFNGSRMLTTSSGGGTIGTMASLANGSPLVFGAESDFQLPFYGQLDDIKLYKYPLTRDQVRTDMNAGAVSFQ